MDEFQPLKIYRVEMTTAWKFSRTN
jgi:hypothetical protein